MASAAIVLCSLSEKSFKNLRVIVTKTYEFLKYFQLTEIAYVPWKQHVDEN